jgi:hypothetical protein
MRGILAAERDSFSLTGDGGFSAAHAEAKTVRLLGRSRT